MAHKIYQDGIFWRWDIIKNIVCFKSDKFPTCKEAIDNLNLILLSKKHKRKVYAVEGGFKKC